MEQSMQGQAHEGALSFSLERSCWNPNCDQGVDRGSFEHLPLELTAIILKGAASEGGSHVATLRLICSKWKDLVDLNTDRLVVRSWPSCPHELATRWPKVTSVDVNQNMQTAQLLPKGCKQLTASSAYPLLDALSRLPKLKSLRLGELHPNSRRARDFAVRFVANVARLPKLSTLDLSGSGISQLPPSLLCACTSLAHLSINGSRLQSLPVGLGRLSGLVHLSAASSTRLQAVPEAAIARLTTLSSLDLHGCKLQALPHALPPSLQSLCVAGNRLTALPESLSQLRSLTHLDVSENQLRSLPDMRALTGLIRLQISSNWHLGGMQAALPACMPALVLLDASGIGLKNLPPTFSCPKLEELLLSSNDLAEVPACLQSMKRLRTLSLDYNELDCLPNWLGSSLSALTSLDVSGNAIHALPEGFGDGGLASSLSCFTATSNALASLPASFSHLRNLVELDLSDNKLGPVMPPMVLLPKLAFLSMASNGLQELGQEVGRLKHLRWLDVSDNMIEALPLHVLQSSLQLEVFNIRGNKLNDTMIFLSDHSRPEKMSGEGEGSTAQKSSL